MSNNESISNLLAKSRKGLDQVNTKPQELEKKNPQDKTDNFERVK